MKKIIIVGSMVFAITVGGVSWNSHASASPIMLDLNTTAPVKEDLLHILKLSSNEELYNALYDGNTLADLAKDNDVDVQKVINLQVAELTAHIDQRYARGNLTDQQYKEQKSEVRDLITQSVHGL
ncbi:hypothetical protein PBAT_15190 [Paenibacillus antarcticus]|uniref:Uncharacterized protein n=2 Tax=Paenibacillus antarcticus TaxID=253703 RepID=A0A162KD74_9BACL|nr:hypothetical protein [Paenibacillus antarcticus]OAB44918.1 hypothetical protein PBAT_15190 [Paenibacillus antarcticus]